MTPPKMTQIGNFPFFILSKLLESCFTRSVIHAACCSQPARPPPACSGYCIQALYRDDGAEEDATCQPVQFAVGGVGDSPRAGLAPPVLKPSRRKGC
jgi:hypothetical protein